MITLIKSPMEAAAESTKMGGEKRRAADGLIGSSRLQEQKNLV